MAQTAFNRRLPRSVPRRSSGRPSPYNCPSASSNVAYSPSGTRLSAPFGCGNTMESCSRKPNTATGCGTTLESGPLIARRMSCGVPSRAATAPISASTRWSSTSSRARSAARAFAIAGPTMSAINRHSLASRGPGSNISDRDPISSNPTTVPADCAVVSRCPCTPSASRSGMRSPASTRCAVGGTATCRSENARVKYSPMGSGSSGPSRVTKFTVPGSRNPNVTYGAGMKRETAPRSARVIANGLDSRATAAAASATIVCSSASASLVARRPSLAIA